MGRLDSVLKDTADIIDQPSPIRAEEEMTVLPTARKNTIPKAGRKESGLSGFLALVNARCIGV